MPQAIIAWEHVAQLDPHGLTQLRNLVRLHLANGDRAGAARWARRALETDRALRLDPLERLTDDDRERLEQLIRSEP